MYLNPLGGNNFYFGSRSNAPITSTPVQMRAPLMKDSISFGNSNSEARGVVLKVVKDIFKQLEFIKNTDVSASSKSEFKIVSQNIFNQLHKSFADIKNADLATLSKSQVIELEDGSVIQPYKGFGGYFFDHASKDLDADTKKELFNSIEIGLDGNAKISSFVTDGAGKIFTISAKGILGEKSAVTEVKFG